MKSPGTLHRRAVVETLLAERGDLLVVAGLGAPAWDITAAGDHPRNLPLWGGMGASQPRHLRAVRDRRRAERGGGGPVFAQVKIDPETLPLVLPPREGALLQARMREAILGPDAHLA